MRATTTLSWWLGGTRRGSRTRGFQCRRWPFGDVPGCASSGRSTRSHRRGRSRLYAGRTEAAERRLPSEQLDALEQAGRDLRARDGDPDRLKALPGLHAEALEHAAPRGLDPLGRVRLSLAERVEGRRHDLSAAVQIRRLDLLEEEAD